MEYYYDGYSDFDMDKQELFLLHKHTITDNMIKAYQNGSVNVRNIDDENIPENAGLNFEIPLVALRWMVWQRWMLATMNKQRKDGEHDIFFDLYKFYNRTPPQVNSMHIWPDCGETYVVGIYGVIETHYNRKYEPILALLTANSADDEISVQGFSYDLIDIMHEKAEASYED